MKEPYTPGVWLAEERVMGKSWQIVATGWGEEPIIAHCYGDARSGASAENNARLMAAAPELLEALESLLRNAEDKAKYISMLEDKEELDANDNVIANYSPEMDRAKAAIAKAKGTL